MIFSKFIELCNTISIQFKNISTTTPIWFGGANTSHLPTATNTQLWSSNQVFHPLVLWDWFTKGRWTNPEPYLELSLEEGVLVCPDFGKFTLCHFTFMKDLHEHLFLLTKRNPPKKERQKVKTAFRVCFAASCYKGSEHPKKSQWHCQAPSQRTTLSISASSCQSFELCVRASVP